MAVSIVLASAAIRAPAASAAISPKHSRTNRPAVARYVAFG